MKIAILGDTHHGMRADSLVFHSLYSKFYKETFFPYLLKNNIKTVFQMGDLFDRRKYISFQSLALSRRYFFDEFARHGIELHTLLGNHDIAYRNTLEINSPELLLKEYDNVFVYNEPTTWNGIDIIPWICKSNEQQSLDYIKNSTSQMCFGHFELAGFEMDQGLICQEGMDASILSRYELVLSGHFHVKSRRNNIVYVGAPGEMTWADFDNERGFHILDTETKELTFVENPHKMFYKINYNDEAATYDDIVLADYSKYKNKYVKVVVENRTNSFLFDSLIEQLTKVGAFDISVVEDFSDVTLSSDMGEVNQAQDTVSILNTYVDSLTLPVEPDRIKSILREVYFEAISMDEDEE